MKITIKGKRITLQGIPSEVVKCSAISAPKLKGLLRRKAVIHCVQLWAKPASSECHADPSPVCLVSDSTSSELPPEISDMLQEYSQLFQDPDSLPPERFCDHHIPLMPGSHLVNTRSYRYASAQKAEIEKIAD